jgi:hypothetical protein
VAQPLLYCEEAFSSYAFFHLAEVGFSRHFVAVSAGGPHFLVSVEPFNQVFDVRYLLQLAQQQSTKVTFRLVLYRVPCSLKMQVFPEDEVERT